MRAFLKCIQLLTIMIILFFFVSTSWYAYILARILSSNNNAIIYDVMFKWRGKTTSNTACHNVIVRTYTLFFKLFINNKIQEIHNQKGDDINGAANAWFGKTHWNALRVVLHLKKCFCFTRYVPIEHILQHLLVNWTNTYILFC
jgi:hypothetical protein